MSTVYGFIRFALLSVAGLFSTVVLLGIVGVLRLLIGPIDAPVPQALLDKIVADAAPGWQVRVKNAQLDFSSDDGLSGLKLRDVVLANTSGEEIVNVPVLGLRFAMVPSLDPTEILTVREIALSGASLDVIRDTDGALQLAFGDLPGDLSTSHNGGGDPVASFGDLATLENLPQLRIEDAQIHYTDHARGTTWRTEKARFTVAPTDTGLETTLDIVVDGGVGGARLKAVHIAETGAVNATLMLDDVRPSRVAELDPILAELARIDAPLSGEFKISADDGGDFQHIAASLTAAGGTVTLDKAPVALKAFSAELGCDIASEKCEITKLSITTPEFRTDASGTFRQGHSNTLLAELKLTNTHLQNEGIQLSTNSAAIKAAFDRETGTMKVERVGLESFSITGLPNGNSLDIAKIAGAAVYDPSAEEVSLPIFAAQNIRIAGAQGVQQKLGEVRASLTFNKVTQQLNVSTFQANSFTSSTSGLSIQVHDASGNVDFDLEAGRVNLADTVVNGTRIAEVSSGTSTIDAMTVRGVFDFSSQTLTDGALKVASAAVSIPRFYPAPLSLENAKVRLAAKHTDGTTKLSLKEITAKIDDLPVKVQGKFAFRKNGTSVGRINATFGSAPAARIPHHWPLGVAPGGLRWVSKNVKSGYVDAVTLDAQFDEAKPALDTLDLRFGFRDALVTFSPDMPPVQGAMGDGHVTLDRLDVTVSGGHVQAPEAGVLSISGSQFSIADFSPDIPFGEVKLKARGHIQSALRFLDADPINAISPTGFDIIKAKGDAEAQVLLNLPLSNDLRIDDVQFDARAKIHKYSLVEPQTDLPVSGDLLMVKATEDGLVLQSDARVGGLAARLGYAEGFAKPKPGEPNSILTLESFLSLNDFARHGLMLDDYVEGLTAVKARVEMFDGGAARINADADLTNLVLKADALGWRKAAGVPATIKLAGYRNANGASAIEALALRGEDMMADGSIGLSNDGQITRANFGRIKLGSAIDTGLIFGRKTNGRVGILLKGSRIDLRRAFSDALEGDASPSPQSTSGQNETDISLQIGRVLLRDDLGVFNLTGGIRLRGRDLRAANVSGKLNGSASAKVIAEQRPDGMAIRLTSPDAGAFIRATDLFTGAYDGSMVLDAIRQGQLSPAKISGRVLINNMIVHDAPTLGRILSGGAIGTLMSDLADGGIRFSKIELPFRGVGSQWQIQDGVAFGPQLGLTLDGGYDLARRDLDLNGSISPAYAINGALGNVPLVGSLLTGGEGEGLFGVTFSVDGDTNKPVVSVNPLSALAPGFLRKMFAEIGTENGRKALPSAGNDK